MSQDTSIPIPLDSPLRVVPIHPHLSDIKLPDQSSTGAHPYTINPLTLQPFTIEELRSHNFEGLLAQYTNQDAARKARDEAVTEVKQRMHDIEQRSKEVDKEVEEKQKTREIERKVYMKRLGKDTN